MKTLTPLTRLQLDKLIDEAEKRSKAEKVVAARLRVDGLGHHVFAPLFDAASHWWIDMADALNYGEHRLAGGQHVALRFLEAELKIKRPKVQVAA